VLLVTSFTSESHVIRAEKLAAEIAAGHPLTVFPSPILLGWGEVLHAEATAEGWRFHAVDVVVERRRPIAAGLLTLGMSAALTSIGNRRALREAERLAASGWRPLGTMPVLATNQRLLLLHDGAWGSVWYSAIRQLVPCPVEGRLDLIFEADPPYLLVGEWVPYLTVVITAVLAQCYGVDAVASMLRGRRSRLDAAHRLIVRSPAHARSWLTATD
jgi:hypothetical protein